MTDTAAAEPNPTVAEDGPVEGAGADSTSPRPPTKTLPSTRAKPENQLAYLRAFAAVSGPGRGVVQIPAVAEIADVHASTISSCNGFFSENGLIQKEGRGYKVPEEVHAFNQAHRWDKDTAAHKLAPLLKRTWFWQALDGKLSFRELSEDEAVATLADACSADPEYRGQLEMILDLLASAGMIRRADGKVGLIHRKADPTHDVGNDQQSPPTTNPPVTPPTAATTDVNTISINLSATLAMAEVAKWNNPAQVTKVFQAWADLVNKKNEFEAMLRGEFPGATSTTPLQEDQGAG